VLTRSGLFMLKQQFLLALRRSMCAVSLRLAVDEHRQTSGAHFLKTRNLTLD
jgi:hypothetical protein